MSGCRGPVEQDSKIQRVYVWCLGNQEPNLVEYIEHGLEEEGVHWAVQSGFDDDEISVAYEAALESSLKIGMSVSPDARIVLHHKQLPDDEPLFDVAAVTPAIARKIGANSARLAKGTPFKPIN